MTTTTPLACPACGSHDTVEFRQPASKFSLSAGIPGLRCNHCGHRAVGRAFPRRNGIPMPGGVQPVARTSPPPRPQPRPAVQAPPKPAAPPKPVVQAPPPPEPEPEIEVQDEEPEVEVETCEWKDCDNAVRPGSKYCCRACSNKNARWRYKQRAKAERREAA